MELFQIPANDQGGGEEKKNLKCRWVGEVEKEEQEKNGSIISSVRFLVGGMDELVVLQGDGGSLVFWDMTAEAHSGLQHHDADGLIILQTGQQKLAGSAR